MAEKKEFERKIIDEMKELGYTHIEAKITVYMLKNETAISKAIEHETGLRQPEASVGLTKLRKMGLLKKEDMKLKGKGRPIHKYSLKKSINETKAEILKVARQKIDKQQEHLASLDAYFVQFTK